MTQAEKLQDKKPVNPLVWVSIVVVGLILAIFLMSNRGGVTSQNTAAPAIAPAPGQSAAEKMDKGMEDASSDSSATSKGSGAIKRDAQAAPGARARSFIKQLRDQGKPYPFDKLMAQASAYAAEGSLADAYLTFFFAAREGSVEAMMMMAEMSDPTMFRSENNLLDKPDAIQAYMWYKRARDAGFEPAQPRLDNLHQWAIAEAKFGNEDARQLLLNY